MKNLKRKGFTIVELVIVIAVIAILAAVLIPTFSNIVKKAKGSADQIAVKNMNTILALEENVDKDRIVALDILEKAGFSIENLIPETENYKFYWNSTYNMVLLVDCTDEDNLVVVYPQNIDKVVEDFINNFDNSYDLSNVLPRASLKTLDNLIVQVKNLGEQKLDVGVSLSATEDVANPEFERWEADFTISFNRSLEFTDNINNDGTVSEANKIALFLGGQYDAFGTEWLAFSATVATSGIQANEEVRVIGSVTNGSGIEYSTICGDVDTFNCGIKIIPGEGVTLSGLIVTLRLRLYDPNAENESQKSYVICTFSHTYE